MQLRVGGRQAVQRRRRRKKEEHRRAKEEREQLAMSMKQTQRAAAEKGRSLSPTRRNVLARAEAIRQSPDFQEKKLRRRRRRSHERDE